MTETFESLKGYFATWLGVNTTRLPDADRGAMLNMAQRDLLRNHELSFGEHSDTFVTAIADADYTLPTGFSKPYEFWYLDTDTDCRRSLIYKTKFEFDALFPDPTVTNKPSHYTWWGNTIYIGPTPDRVVTINRLYYRLLPDLADGSPDNTNDLIENAWEAVFFRALVLASQYLIEDPRLPVWEARAGQLEVELVREYRRSRSFPRDARSRVSR